jgi:hypothetical protein
MRIIAVVLLVVGAVLGFVVPCFWGDLYSVGVRILSKPPRTIQFSVTALLRITGAALMALSILCFVVSRRSAGG